MVYIVPQADGKNVKLILSEDLEEDPDIKIAMFGKPTLALRDPAGKDRTLPMEQGDHAFSAPLGEGGQVDGSRIGFCDAKV